MTSPSVRNMDLYINQNERHKVKNIQKDGIFWYSGLMEPTHGIILPTWRNHTWCRSLNMLRVMISLDIHNLHGGAQPSSASIVVLSPGPSLNIGNKLIITKSVSQIQWRNLYGSTSKFLILYVKTLFTRGWWHTLSLTSIWILGPRESPYPSQMDTRLIYHLRLCMHQCYHGIVFG